MFCSQHGIVKTAEEGGAVRLVTHLENYSNGDIGKHMYSTVSVYLSYLFSLSLFV